MGSFSATRPLPGRRDPARLPAHHPGRTLGIGPRGRCPLLEVALRLPRRPALGLADVRVEPRPRPLPPLPRRRCRQPEVRTLVAVARGRAAARAATPRLAPGVGAWVGPESESEPEPTPPSPPSPSPLPALGDRTGPRGVPEGPGTPVLRGSVGEVWVARRLKAQVGPGPGVPQTPLGPPLGRALPSRGTQGVGRERGWGREGWAEWKGWWSAPVTVGPVSQETRSRWWPRRSQSRW